MQLTVAGCVNVDGTTCFLNAALQALASSVALTQHVLQLLQRVQQGSSAELPAWSSSSSASPLADMVAEAARCDLLVELAACLQALQPQEEVPAGAPRPRPVHPLSLQRALKAGLPRSQLEWGTQHDAAEALEALCDVLQQELDAWALLHGAHAPAPSTGVGLAVLAPAHAAAAAPGCAGHQPEATVPAGGVLFQAGGWQPPRGASPAQAAGRLWASPPWRGSLLHSVACLACGARSTDSLQPFTVLPLPLPLALGADGEPRVRPGASVAECLGRFTAAEVVEGWQCPQCSLAATLQGQHAEACGSGARAAGELGPGGQRHAAAALLMQQHLGSAARRMGLGSWASAGAGSGAAVTAGPAAAGPHAELAALAACGAPLPEGDYAAQAAQAGLCWAPVPRPAAKQARLARPPAVLLLQAQRSVHVGALRPRKLHGWLAFPLALQAGPLLAYPPPASCGRCRCCRGGQPVVGAADAGSAAGTAAVSSLDAAWAAAGLGLSQPQQPQAACCAARRLSYHLRAVVQHLGEGASSGHYVLFRRLDPGPCPAQGACSTCGRGGGSGSAQAAQPAGPNQGVGERGGAAGACWVRVSDEAVSPAKLTDVLACEAALLLYESEACTSA